MNFEVTPDRPLTMVIAGSTSRGRTGGPRRTAYAPPTVVWASGPAADLPGDAVSFCSAVLRCLLLEEDLGDLAEGLHPDLVTWTPRVYLTTRDELTVALHHPLSSAEPLTELRVEVTSADTVPPKVFLAWRLVGRFSSPCFIGDDVMVEPTGRLVETAGLLVASYAHGQVRALHGYVDDLALLEQILPPS